MSGVGTVGGPGQLAVWIDSGDGSCFIFRKTGSPAGGINGVDRATYIALLNKAINDIEAMTVTW